MSHEFRNKVVIIYMEYSYRNYTVRVHTSICPASHTVYTSIYSMIHLYTYNNIIPWYS